MDSPDKNRRKFLSQASFALASAGVVALPRPWKAYGGQSSAAAQGKEIIHRTLGRTGFKVPIVSMGVMNANNPELIGASYDIGVRLFDTAARYQFGRNEQMVGEAISELGIRDKVLIATKFFSKVGEGPNDRGTSRKHLMQAVEDSLRRLDIDYLDLYQVHRWDDSVPIEETLRGLDDLITQGKVRYIGSSGFAAWQIAHAQAVSELHNWNKFVSEQPHYHMLEREIEKEVLPACEYFKIGVLPYFPLAGGFLTGKYLRGQGAPEGSRGETNAYVQGYMTGENYDQLEKLTAFAEEREHTVNDLAHAWLLAQPMVSSVISGATKVEHTIANAQAGDWELSAEELEAVNQILNPEEAEE